MAKSYVAKILNYLKNPKRIFVFLATRGFFNWMPDRLYIKCFFEAKLGYKLNLDMPKTFNEKLQWLKLNNHDQNCSILVDKYAVKQWVAEKIGKQHIIATLGVWQKFEDIDFDKLPNQFVLKCTHDSGGVVICKNKQSFDFAKAKKILSKSLNKNFFFLCREWPYKVVKPQIIAEQYLEEASGDLKDYKFFCFNGKVHFFKIDFDRFSNHKANYYSTEGKILPFYEGDYPNDLLRNTALPNSLSQMISIAEKLSSGYPFLRIDLYDCNGQIFFGEATFYPAGGFGKIEPKEWDEKIGNLINLKNF